MIFLFAGDDAKNKNIHYQKFIGSIPKSSEVFLINRNDFDPMQIESLYSSSGLFFTKSAAIFSGILENEGTRDFILEKLPLMSESKNDFIFLEGKLTKPILTAFDKAHAETTIFELAKEKKEKFNNFLLANAFGDRNKFNLWLYFRQAVDRGVVMEELIGVLFWKIKDRIIKKDFRKFSEVELGNSAAKLSYVLPEARKSGLDAESAFEQFLLEVF